MVDTFLISHYGSLQTQSGLFSTLKPDSVSKLCSTVSVCTGNQALFGLMSSLACDVCSCDLISLIDSRHDLTGACFNLGQMFIYSAAALRSTGSLAFETLWSTHTPWLLLSRPVIGQRVLKLSVNIAPSWFGVHLAKSSHQFSSFLKCSSLLPFAGRVKTVAAALLGFPVVL